MWEKKTRRQTLPTYSQSLSHLLGNIIYFHPFFGIVRDRQFDWTYPHKLRGPFESLQYDATWRNTTCREERARCVLIRIHEIQGRCVHIRIYAYSYAFARYKRDAYSYASTIYEQDAYLCVYIYMDENSMIEEERYRRGPIKILLLTLTVDMVV